MFEAYRVVVRFRSGVPQHGYGLSFEEGAVRWRGVPGGALDRSAWLSDVRVLVLARSAGRPLDPILRTLRPGAAVLASFADGEELAGRTLDVPIGGGVWLEPDGAEHGSMLAFVPEGAASVQRHYAEEELSSEAWKHYTDPRLVLPEGVIHADPYEDHTDGDLFEEETVSATDRFDIDVADLTR